ncbi:hypothetical protein TRVL_08285 [Trypanosoma vivax]|nr:hypothetical protein TRVL_08285 [Trypanosoma vivax]
MVDKAADGIGPGNGTGANTTNAEEQEKQRCGEDGAGRDSNPWLLRGDWKRQKKEMVLRLSLLLGSAKRQWCTSRGPGRKSQRKNKHCAFATASEGGFLT